MKKRLLYFISCVLFVTLITVGVIRVSDQYSYAESQKDFYDILISAGQAIETNSDLLSKSIYFLNNPGEKAENVIAVIDNIELSDFEYQFRKGIYEATGFKSSDDNTVFNTLVEEKMLLSYAAKNNLLPLESEVDLFIEQEKKFYNRDANTKKAIDALCSAANISIDQYWSTYEYYNAYRAVAFKKVFDNVISKGVKQNIVRALEDNNKVYYHSEIVKEQFDFYNQFKIDLKAIIDIKIEEPYKYKSFRLDSSKLYL